MLGKNPFNKNRDEICAFMIYMVLAAMVWKGKKGALCAPCKVVVNQKKRRQECKEFKEFERENLNCVICLL